MGDVSFLCVRFVRLGDLGRLAVRRTRCRDAVLDEPHTRTILRNDGGPKSDGAQPDAFGVPPVGSVWSEPGVAGAADSCVRRRGARLSEPETVDSALPR